MSQLPSIAGSKRCVGRLYCLLLAVVGCVVGCVVEWGRWVSLLDPRVSASELQAGGSVPWLLLHCAVCVASLRGCYCFLPSACLSLGLRWTLQSLGSWEFFFPVLSFSPVLDGSDTCSPSSQENSTLDSLVGVAFSLQVRFHVLLAAVLGSVSVGAYWLLPPTFGTGAEVPGSQACFLSGQKHAYGLYDLTGYSHFGHGLGKLQ